MDPLQFVSTMLWPATVVLGMFLFRKPISGLISGLKPTRLKGFGVDAEFNAKLDKADELTAPTLPPTLPPPPTTAAQLPSPIDGSSSSPPNVGKLGASEQGDHANVAGQVEDGQQQPALPSVRPHVGSAYSASGLEALRQAFIDALSAGPPSPALTVMREWRELEGTLLSSFRRRMGKTELTHPPPRADALRRAARAAGFTEDELAALKELQAMRNWVTHGKDEIGELDAARYADIARRLRRKAIVAMATADFQESPPATEEEPRP